MKKINLFLGIALMLCSLLLNAQDIFKQHGFTKEPLTLSNGNYNEFFNNDEVVQVGTVLLNTKTMNIVAFVKEETDTTYKAELSSRWLSPDPLAAKYPQVSPYVYCLNNPIIFIDPDGRIVKPAPGSNKAFIDNYNAASNLLISKGVGGSFNQLVSSSDVYYIQEDAKSYYNAATMTISWNPSSALEVNDKVVLSPTGIFGHEIEHAKNHDDARKAWMNGEENAFYDWVAGTQNGTSANYKSKEEENVITGAEQRIAKALGSIGENETTRNSYIGKTVRVEGINLLEKPKQLQPLEPIKPYIPTVTPMDNLKIE